MMREYILMSKMSWIERRNENRKEGIVYVRRKIWEASVRTIR